VTIGGSKDYLDNPAIKLYFSLGERRQRFYATDELVELWDVKEELIRECYIETTELGDIDSGH